ncbi:uncharacterized protein [Heterodontus francisci]|uniref:uncharacterized protein n=1 Tax=Heterodontus francisci TaxID=7792 RepID=UPI00355C28CB
MAEEKKLKLKRKRVTVQLRKELNPNPRLTDICHLITEAGNDPPREQPGADSKESPLSVSTWLNDDDLNETDHIWALLIKAVFPDVKVSDWKTVSVPDLPSNPEKILKSSERVTTEIISAEKDIFTWIPFPPACKAVALEVKHRSRLFSCWGDDATSNGEMMDITDPQMGKFHLSLSETLQSEGILSCIDAAKCLDFTKENDNGWATGYLGNVKSGDVFGAGPTELAASKHEKSYPVDQRHGRGYKPVDVTHCPVVSRNEREPKQSVLGLQSNAKPHKGKTIQHKMTRETLYAEKDNADFTGECPDHSFTAGGFCATSKMSAEGAVNKERPDGQVERELDLESCPMCLVPFPAGFSLLEVDSHLAKCLSESTEDVIW